MALTSIILPNLNTNVNFLSERVESILVQSQPDFECIVIDGFSTNGSYEYLKSFEKDQRFKVYQRPKKGIYNAWNEGIKLAKGEWIYIATSDDTMDKSFLEVMLNALDERSDCDIAHCSLKIIDEHGNDSSTHVWDNYPSARFFGDKIHTPHVRLAPHDGILHAFIKTVYHSITQLLIRKKVFDELGLFLEDKGPIADYEWGLRVSLYKNVVHVPYYLATWRVHEAQATTSHVQFDPSTYQTLTAWVQTNVAKYLNADGARGAIDLQGLTRVYRLSEQYYRRQQLSRHNLFYRILNRLSPMPKPVDGLAEAIKYFEDQSLTGLVQQYQPVQSH